MKALHKLLFGLVMTMAIGGFSFLTEFQIMNKTLRFEVNHQQNVQLTKFLQFCAKFHKNYIKRDKFDDKLEKFKQTLDLIEQENKNTSNTFELGITELADMSDKEFKEISTGLDDIYYKNLPSIQIEETEFMTEQQKQESKDFVKNLDEYDFSHVKIEDR